MAKREYTNRDFVPHPGTNFYRRTREDGITEYMTMGSVVIRGQSFTGWANHPSFGLEMVNNEEHSLAGFEPVLSVSQEDYEALEARVAGLEAMVADLLGQKGAKTTTKSKGTLECKECGFMAKAAVGLAAHMRSHKKTDLPV